MAFKWLSGNSYQSIATHSTISNLSIAETSTHHELGFMTALPSDIIPEIFSYLDQKSSLECMAVCRYWYDAVPQHVEKLWYSLRLHSRDAYMDHQRRERCVGKHVKEVVLEPPRSSFQVEEQEVYILIQKVSEWGCTSIRKLGISSHYHQRQLWLLMVHFRAAFVYYDKSKIVHGTHTTTGPTSNPHKDVKSSV